VAPGCVGPQQAATTKEPSTRPDDGQPNLIASRRYFNAVNRIIDDLDRAHRRGSSYSHTAQWHINFADRIDHRPTEGVDPELLTFGRDVSSRLRALGDSLHGVAVEVDRLDRYLVYNVYAGPAGGWGYSWATVVTNLEDVRAKQAEAVSAGQPVRSKIWQLILEDREAVNEAMINRYGMDFAIGQK
jgi:hypothetical protein